MSRKPVVVAEMSDQEALRSIEARAENLRGDYKARLDALRDAVVSAEPAGLIAGGFASGFVTDRLIAGGGEVEKALSAAEMVLAFARGIEDAST